MPNFFKFVRRSDNLAMSLNAMDALICEAYGVPLNETDYSQEFQMISSIGDAAMSSGSWNEEMFVKLTDNYKNKDIVRRFLNGEYVYDCWYARQSMH